MPRPQLWNAILIGALGLLFMGIAIIYPTTKSVIVGVETNGTTWNELNGASQPACTYASYYALPRSLLNHIACVISTSCQRLHRFITACANVTVFETVGLLPSPSWELPRLGGGVNQHILSGRSFITTLTENRACDSIVDYAERQACIKKVGQNDKIYVIVSIIVVVLACIGFAALIVRYVRCDHRAAALRKNDQPVSMVGLGRGLGSDAVGIRSSSSKSEQNKDSEKDLEKNSDELVASTWRVPAPRRNSTGWKHFLRGGPSVCLNLPLNTLNFFYLPPSYHSAMILMIGVMNIGFSRVNRKYAPCSPFSKQTCTSNPCTQSRAASPIKRNFFQ